MTRARLQPGVRTVVLPLPREYQHAVLASPARFKVLLCGRRWGKSKASLIALFEGHGPTRGYHRGALQGGRCAWILPSEKSQAFREAWADVKASAGAAAVRVSEEEHSITLPGGGSVWVLGGYDPDAHRGVFWDGVVIDECSLQAESLWSTAIRPTLTDYNGWAVFAGTMPLDWETHWFPALLDRAMGPLRGRGWEGWNRPTSDNPQFTAEEQAAAREEMGLHGRGAYEREYDAQRVRAEGGYWQLDWFAERRWEELPDDGWDRLVLVLDAAWETGVRNDYSCCQLWGKRSTEYWLIDQWWAQRDSPALRAEVNAWRRSWLPFAEGQGLSLSLYCEAYGGGLVNAQEFRHAADYPVEFWRYAKDKDAPPGGGRPSRKAVKIARHEAVNGLGRTGKVWVPSARAADWIDGTLGEVVGFPDLAHDDRADAWTMGLLVLGTTVDAARTAPLPPRRPALRERGGY